MFPPPQDAPIRKLAAQRGFITELIKMTPAPSPPDSPCFFGAQHLGPDEVCVDGFLFGVGGADLEGERLAGGPGQRGQAFDSSTCLQSKVGAMELGQCFFYQSHPELLPLGLEREHEIIKESEFSHYLLEHSLNSMCGDGQKGEDGKFILSCSLRQESNQTVESYS